MYANNVTAIDLESKMPAHVDIPRLRKGRVGGFFWSVYVDCADPLQEGPDFVDPTWRVRSVDYPSPIDHRGSQDLGVEIPWNRLMWRKA